MISNVGKSAAAQGLSNQTAPIHSGHREAPVPPAYLVDLVTLKGYSSRAPRRGVDLCNRALGENSRPTHERVASSMRGPKLELPDFPDSRVVTSCECNSEGLRFDPQTVLVI